MDGRHRDKVRTTAEEALEGLNDGASIMVGGFGLCGNPEALIAGVVARGPRNLTLISNNAGNLGKGLATWLKAGLIRKVMCSYLGTNDDLHRAMASGEVEVEVIPQGTLVERIRAGGAGIPAFYTPTGVGTVIADGKEVREIDGREYVLERAIKADFALVRGKVGDPFGNMRFWRTARNFNPIMATAARTTIAEVDHMVSLGDIDPDEVHLSGIFIHRVIEVPDHEDSFEYRTVRPRPTRRVDEGG
ncbi:MAG TPA: CoA transferase subunit A [Kofleriaceae bacterium]|nr:CoA transferase subunit A [Kofleriaceae bacterium]